MKFSIVKTTCATTKKIIERPFKQFISVCHVNIGLKFTSYWCLVLHRIFRKLYKEIRADPHFLTLKQLT